MCPGDLGELVKPYVFLDFFDDDSLQMGELPFHPHSGIATLTYLIEGELRYEDSTGASGVLAPGSVEWIRAGAGVWHTARQTKRQRVRGCQVWIALPPELETAPARSIYLGPEDLPRCGPALVLLGSVGEVCSPLLAPSSMNYLALRLQAGEAWRYEPPTGHSVAWLAVSSGTLSASGKICAGEMVVFEESGQSIDLRAQSDTVCILASAAKHPHDLVTGYYSVHTSEDALRFGEAGIRAIAQQLRDVGRLSR
ncbi:MAG: Pirin-related protein [Ramlibacter sp.]|nr:Pirin-related protein [Ramlibacter sp.]